MSKKKIRCQQCRGELEIVVLTEIVNNEADIAVACKKCQSSVMPKTLKDSDMNQLIEEYNAKLKRYKLRQINNEN